MRLVRCSPARAGAGTGIRVCSAGHDARHLPAVPRRIPPRTLRRGARVASRRHRAELDLSIQTPLHLKHFTAKSAKIAKAYQGSTTRAPARRGSAAGGQRLAQMFRAAPLSFSRDSFEYGDFFACSALSAVQLQRLGEIYLSRSGPGSRWACPLARLAVCSRYPGRPRAADSSRGWEITAP